jgi:isopentenyl-diphosphate Delta-isomerase
VAGLGGTSWTWIEAQRANNKNFAEWFKDFGLSAEDALNQITRYKLQDTNKFKLVISGGIRNPIQGLKAHYLGADYYSAARPFLEKAFLGSDKLIELISDWEKGLRIAMFGCGRKKW